MQKVMLRSHRGADLKKTVRLMLNFIATPAVWSHFSVKGHKRKKAFQPTNVYTLVRGKHKPDRSYIDWICNLQPCIFINTIIHIHNMRQEENFPKIYILNYIYHSPHHSYIKK